MDLDHKNREDILEKQGASTSDLMHEVPYQAVVMLEVSGQKGSVIQWEHIDIKGCNQDFTQVLGYHRGDLLENKDIIAGRDKNLLVEKIESLITGEDSNDTFNSIFKTKAGEAIELQGMLNKIPLQIPDHFIFLLQFKPKASGLPQQEKSGALKQLHDALSHSRMLAATTDDAGIILYCNQSFATLLELGPGQITGKNIFDILKPIRGKNLNIQDLLGLMSQDGLSESIRRAFLTSEGKKVEINLVNIIWHHIEGKLKGMTLMAEDISEQKKVRKQLQETHTQLSEFFNKVYDLILVFEENGHLAFVNKAWLSTLQYDEKETHFLAFYDLIHPQYLEATRNYLNRVRAEDRTHKFKTVLVAKDGSHIHVSGSISWKYKVEEGKGEFRAIFHDISEQIRAERAQRLYNSISNFTLQSYDLDTLYINIHRELKKVMYADNFYIALADDQRDIYFPYYIKGQDHFFSNPGEVASEKDLVDYVMTNNQSVILYEEDMLDLLVSTVIRPRKVVPQIWLGVPLLVNKRVIGILVVQHYERRNVLDQRDLELLNFVSGQVALAIERKRNEEKLNEQTSRLNAIFESSTHLIWSVDKNLNFTSFNQNFMQVMQIHYSVQPVIQHTYSDNEPEITKDYLSQFKGKYLRAFEGRGTQFEMAFQLGPDHFLWKQVFINPVYREDGSIKEVSGIAHDITQRKKSELALLESEEKFRNIFESFQDIYFRCNIDGTITMISPSVVEMTDYETSDVLGKNITNYYLYDSRTKNLVRKLVKNKSVRNFEATVIHSDGKLLQCICNVRLIDHPDRPPEIEGVARDITELKKANQALQKAKDVAEKSLKIKEAFLANMSHEIRTPMNGIVSMIDVLDQTEMDEQQKEYVQIIKGSSETLLSILNDILDLSKMEAGKMKLIKSSVSLARVLHKLNRLFSQRAMEKEISFSYKIGEDMPPYLLLDEVRINQIISNLASNALKFTPEGGEVIVEALDITTEEKKSNPKAEHIIKVTVTDSGIGIADKDQQSLFQNFSQADSSSTKRYEGTGLGLSIARQLVELMQGEIGVDSTLGVGSTFWFTFRARLGNEEVLPANTNVDFSRQWEEAGLVPKVLLVDDNETNRRVAYEIMVHAGCEVDTVSGGRQAIDMIQHQPYDIVLMDIQMPEMDGIEATRQIRELNLSKIPPIVAMTAYSMQGDKEKFMAAGLDDYLSKPIRAHSLIRKIGDLLQIQYSNTEKPSSQNESEIQIINNKIVQDLEKYGGKALIKDIFLDFEVEATDLIAECSKGVENNDIEHILRSLHTLKGSAGTVGIDRLSLCAKEMEAKLKDGKKETLAQDLLSLEENFKEFQKKLKQILNDKNDV